MLCNLFLANWEESHEQGFWFSLWPLVAFSEGTNAFFGALDQYEGLLNACVKICMRIYSRPTKFQKWMNDSCGRGLHVHALFWQKRHAVGPFLTVVFCQNGDITHTLSSCINWGFTLFRQFPLKDIEKLKDQKSTQKEVEESTNMQSKWTHCAEKRTEQTSNSFLKMHSWVCSITGSRITHVTNRGNKKAHHSGLKQEKILYRCLQLTPAKRLKVPYTFDCLSPFQYQLNCYSDRFPQHFLKSA